MKLKDKERLQTSSCHLSILPKRYIKLAEEKFKSMKLINTFRENINNLLDKKIWKFDITFILLCLSIFSYTVIFSLFTIYKHKTFNTYAWDLGIFNQAFWTTTKLNKIFYYTAELYFVKSGSFFGVHFSPILYLLVPFYSLYPHPETLLILQSLICFQYHYWMETNLFNVYSKNLLTKES